MGGDRQERRADPGPPAARWSVAAMARARVGRRDRRRRARRTASTRSRRRLARRRAGRAGRRRRRAALRFGPRTASPPRTADVVLVHDAARPLASPAARRRVAAAPRRSMARRCRSCPSSTRSSAQQRPIWKHRSIASGLVRTQTPQGARRAAAARRVRRGRRRRTYTDEAALLESRGITVATVPGEATEPQGHRARRISRSSAPSPRRATVAAPRPRSPRGSASARTRTALGRRSGCGSVASSIDGRAAPARPLRRRRRPARAATADPVGRRPRRSRPALPADRSDERAASTAPSCSRRPSPGVRRHGLARSIGAQVSLIGARPKLGGQTDRRDARTIWRAARRRCGVGGRSPRRPETSTAPEGAGRVISATRLVSAASAMMRVA